MEKNRWQKIEEIFNRAAVLPIAERHRFVEAVCSDEPDLFSEVISLVDNDCLEDSFLDEPVFTRGARLLEMDYSEFLKTENFGVYRLQKLLGRGGMGAVFLAEDTRLGRPVALKILPLAFADDAKMIERFRQEARLASAISHPRVAHIYEFSQYDDRYFLAMEYVPGQTLRQLIKDGSIDAPRAVEIARQTAEALQAAHAVGIIHRDIKPENIMVTDEGFVKTLDFGISKLAVAASPGENLDAETNNQNAPDAKTTALAGTVVYMSPEQASGQSVDERTDLWSLGAVLYEMLAGKRPFDGASSHSVRKNILNDQPAIDFPPPLNEIIHRALRKNKSERYQTAADFVKDLNSAKRKLTGTDQENSVGGKFFFNSLPQFAVLFAAVTALLIGSWLIYKNFLKTPPGEQKLIARKSVRLNLTSKARSAALSPSGRLLAYSFDEDGKFHLVLKPNDAQVTSAASEKTLVVLDATRIAGLAFSPDEQSVYFNVYEKDKIYADLYRISIEGGEPKKLLSKIENAPNFSPDGRQIVFLRLGEDESHESLITADVDGKSERVLYTRRMPEYISHLATPAWSPDGKTILCSAGRYGVNKQQEVTPVKISVADGQSVPVFSEPWHEIWQMSWLRDGKFFVMVGRKKSADNVKQIWQVNAETGEISRLTDDFNDYFGLSVAGKADGKTVQIGTLVLDRATDLWITDAGEKSESARQITSNADNSYGISWGRDERIVYGSVAGNNFDIWTISADGQQRRQITFEPARDSFPAFSADGAYVFFISERNGVKSLWRIENDGANPILLVNGASSQPFALSPDGKWIYYHSYFSGAAAFWRVSTSGGEPEKIVDGILESPSVAPDNRTLAAVTKNAEGVSKLAIVNLENPAPENWRTLDLIAGANPAAAVAPTALRWTANGEAVAYVVLKKGVGNIWAQPINGGEPKQLTNFTTARIWSFDFSPDGRQIVCSRGDQLRFVTLIQLDEAEQQ